MGMHTATVITDAENRSLPEGEVVGCKKSLIFEQAAMYHTILVPGCSVEVSNQEALLCKGCLIYLLRT
jgi:hypothetical protein